jgi:hypothetical protein
MANPQRQNFLIDLLTRASTEQSRDTGLALVLVCLLLAYFGNYSRFVPLAIIVLLIAILWPQFFRPLAGPWFAFAHFLGNLMSKVILTILFFGLVTPIGWLRHLFGADPLKLKQWKTGHDSVFVMRSGKITADDLEKPY